MLANEVQSYHCKVRMELLGTHVNVQTVSMDLKEPEYRFWTSSNCYRPPFVHGQLPETNSQVGNQPSTSQNGSSNHGNWQVPQLPTYLGTNTFDAATASAWQCEPNLQALALAAQANAWQYHVQQPAGNAWPGFPFGFPDGAAGTRAGSNSHGRQRRRQ
jgi:hypothetical protein